MGVFDRLRRLKQVQIVEEPENYDISSIGNIIIPEKLKDENAYKLAYSVSEIFFPVDFYADRLSKLRYYIADSQNNEVQKSELNRLITDINPLYKFSDLVYQYAFSYLSDGNVVAYRQTPSIYSNNPISVNNITRLDIIEPNTIYIDEYTGINPLKVSSLIDMIKKAEFLHVDRYTQVENLQWLHISNYSGRKRDNSNVFVKSPLFAANKSIDTLLAVYSARYNVYANNGAAGYLAKKSVSNMNIEQQILAPADRDKIIADINSRNGLTGRRNLWGISGVPIEFVKTLATISELVPLEETLENSIKISSVFQIPPVLVPRKDQSTYDNQANAEKIVWENGLLSMASTVCENFTKMLALDKAGYKIQADMSTVSVLVDDEKNKQDLILKKLMNLEKLKSLNPTLDITKEIETIYSENYGKE